MDTPEGSADPDGVSWIPLAPSYLRVRQIRTLIWAPLLSLLGIGVLRWSTGGWLYSLICLVLALPWTIFLFLRQGRVYRAMGYHEGETDLFLRRGVQFRKMSVIPYGRMQAVEVGSGPIDRAFGLAHVTLITAGPVLTVEGLPADQAAELRDRLSRFGREQQAGL